jgi:hypothetical protein
MDHCRGLDFAQRPNYDTLYKMFRGCRLPSTKDYDFEWLKGKVDFDPAELESLKQRARISQPDDLSSHSRGRRQWLMSFLKTRQSKNIATVTPI